MFATMSSPGEIGSWVWIAILIVNGIGAVGGLVAIFATRREVEAIERRVSLAESQRALDLREGSERRAKIYNELSKQRTEFQQEIKDVYKRIEHIEEARNEILRRMPGEIISHMRDSGIIK